MISMAWFRSRPRRLLRPVLLALFTVAVLPVLAAATWNAILDARDRRCFKPPGQLVEVDGLRLHLHCTGQGQPTVILESGWGMPALSWALVQPELAKRVRVCSYDRLGKGYSDPNPSLGPRTQGQIAEQLHALLVRAGERGPFVLVGHSHGGLMARCYYNRYPQEVAAMVQVDCSTEDMDRHFAAVQGEKTADADGSPAKQQWAGDPLSKRLLVRLGYWAGLVRWKARSGLAKSSFSDLPPALIDEFIFLLNQPEWFPASSSEAVGADESYDELRRGRGLGDLPLIVLTSGKFRPNGNYSDELALKMRRAWIEEIQPPLARLSTRSRHVIVDSGHLIPLEAPDAIVQAVFDVNAMISAQEPERSIR